MERILRLGRLCGLGLLLLLLGVEGFGQINNLALFQVDPDPVCVGDTLELVGQGLNEVGFQYQYSIDGVNVPLALILGPINPNSVFLVVPSGISTGQPVDLVVVKSDLLGNTRTRDIAVRIADSYTVNYPNGGVYCASTGGSVLPVVQVNGNLVSSYNIQFTPYLGNPSLDSNTGEVELANSGLGQIVIRWENVFCSDHNFGFDTIQITNSPNNLSLDYPPSPFCQSSDSVELISSLPPGTYAASPNGLAINPTTGAFEPKGSSPGTYQIEFTSLSSSGCQVTLDTTITIVPPIQAIFSYPQSSYCLNGLVNPAPTSFSPAAGTFTSNPPLPINPGTGEITLSNSITPGTYEVKYTPTGARCVFADSTTLTFVASPVVSLSFDEAFYCKNYTTVTPTLVPSTVAGTFFTPNASSPIVWANQATGEINVWQTIDSAGGSVSETIGFETSGPCSERVYATFVANDAQAYFELPAAVCKPSSGTVLATNVGGAGEFTSNLTVSNWINNTPTMPTASLALVNVSNMDTGTHTITLNLDQTGNGACPNVNTFSRDIDVVATVPLSYATTFYCSDANQTVTPVSPVSNLAISVSGSLVVASNGSFVPVGVGTSVIHWQSNVCPGDSGSISIQIAASQGSQTLSYGASTFCESLSAVPVQQGFTNGTFTVSPAGLALDAATGTIQPVNSDTGTYFIQYDSPLGQCAYSLYDTIRIASTLPAQLDYPLDTVCLNSPTNPVPNVLFPTTGHFSSNSALNNFITGAGEVILNNQIAGGTYTIKFTPTDSLCQASDSATIVFVDPGELELSFDEDYYCKNDMFVQPNFTYTGSAPGSFFLPDPNSPIVFSNTMTGEIDVWASVDSGGGRVSSEIGFITSGPCPDTVYATFTANDARAYFEIPDIVCDPSAGVVYATDVGGEGTFLTSLSVSPWINNSPSSPVDSLPLAEVTNMTPGLHTITFLVTSDDSASSGCPNNRIYTDDILVLEEQELIYADTFFCANVSDTIYPANPILNIEISDSGNISVDSITGAFVVSPASAGTSVITWRDTSCAGGGGRITIVIANTPAVQYLTYQAGPLCQSLTSVMAQIPPALLGEGTLQASPAGLTIDPADGTLNPSSSNTGTYIVQYLPDSLTCADTLYDTVVVAPQGDAQFIFPQSVYCTKDTFGTPDILGDPSGVFSLPVGSNAVLTDTALGTIDLDSSAQQGSGNFLVNYTSPGPCPTTVSQSLQIENTSPNFFLEDSICTSEIPLLAATQITSPGILYVTEVGGGNYSDDDANISANPTVPFSVPSSGEYQIKYELTSNSCPDSMVQTLVVEGYDAAYVSYPYYSFCPLEDTIAPDSLQILGGTFFSTSPGLAIDPVTGGIDPSTSSVGGPYSVFYILEGGQCIDTFLVSSAINIQSALASSLLYPDSACENGGFLQNLGVSGPGSFVSVPPGVQFNPNGDINLFASDTGTYQLIFVPPLNACVDSAFDTVQIKPIESADFSFLQGIYCAADSNPRPMITGLAGGTFSLLGSSGANVVLADSTTGEIDLAQSLTGVNPYGIVTVTLQYLTNGFCSDSHVETVSLQNSNAEFVFPDTVCNSSNAILTVTGISSGGIFSTLDSLNLIQGNIAVSGGTTSNIVDVGDNPPGLYTIQYTTNNPNCADTTVQTLYIAGHEGVVVDYGVDSVCIGGANIPSPNPSPSGGGYYETVIAGPVAGSGLQFSGALSMGAASPGTYQINYVLEEAGCRDTFPAVSTVTIEQVIPSQISYPSTVYCQGAGASDPADVNGVPGYFFSSSSVLVLDSTTGIIDLDSTPIGTYDVQFTAPASECRSYNPISIVVRGFSGSFSYDSTVCQTAANLSPHGTSMLPGNGVFVMEGLNNNYILGAFGFFDPDSIAPGSYQIYYDVDDPICPERFAAPESLVVSAPPNINFSYGSQSFCIDDPDPIPVPITPGGSYSSPDSNLVFTGVFPGQIDLDSTGPGGITINYAISNGCEVDTSISVTISDLDDSYFEYADSVVCQGAGGVPTIIAPSIGSGFFSASSLGLDVDGNNGYINLDSSAVGTYWVYFQSTGSCPTEDSVSIQIVGGPMASILYPQVSYCETDTVMAQPIFTDSLYMGTFQSTPPGLVIDSLTGYIDVLASDPGVYSVTHDISTVALCAARHTVTQEIAGIDTSFGFVIQPEDIIVCAGESNVQLQTLGAGQGTFNSTPPLTWVDNTTGIVNVASSSPGQYNILYTKLQSICLESVRAEFEIRGLDNSDFWYGSLEYCQFGDNPVPTAMEPGGIFHPDSSSATVLDSISGMIDLTQSAIGPHYITYEISEECPAFSQELIIINAAPEPPIFRKDSGNVTTICLSDTAKIGFNSTSVLAFSYSGGAFPVGAVSDNEITFAGFEQGDFVSIISTNFVGCESLLRFPITVNDYPILEILSRPEALANGESAEIELTSQVDSTTFMWTAETIGTIELDRYADMTMGELPATIQSEITLNSDYSPGQLTYFITPIANNCPGEPDTLVINVNPGDHPIFIPGIITPNGNGQNDTWLIQWEDDINPYEYRLVLFNRGGGKVMEMSPLHNQWGGENLPDGLYRWVLMNAKDQVELAGGLTLRRK